MAGMAVVLRSDGSRFCTRACSLFTDGAQGGNGKCFNNKRVEITGIEARNEVFGENYPRQYETWKETAKPILKASLMAMKR